MSSLAGVRRLSTMDEDPEWDPFEELEDEEEGLALEDRELGQTPAFDASLAQLSRSASDASLVSLPLLESSSASSAEASQCNSYYFAFLYFFLRYVSLH